MVMVRAVGMPKDDIIQRAQEIAAIRQAEILPQHGLNLLGSSQVRIRRLGEQPQGSRQRARQILQQQIREALQILVLAGGEAAAQLVIPGQRVRDVEPSSSGRRGLRQPCGRGGRWRVVPGLDFLLLLVEPLLALELHGEVELVALLRDGLEAWGGRAPVAVGGSGGGCGILRAPGGGVRGGRGGTEVVVCALVGCDYEPRVVGGALDALSDWAFRVCAAVVAPAKRIRKAVRWEG